jgi:two-component system response regulator FixJ
MGRALVHLVEDDCVVRTMLTRLLQSGGYRVEQYSSGADFLDVADRIADGCILLDVNVNMPEPDGFAVKRALAERGISVPVIMMSGSGDLSLLAMRAGVDDFMQKPFDRSELLSVLREVLIHTEAHV